MSPCGSLSAADNRGSSPEGDSAPEEPAGCQEKTLEYRRLRAPRGDGAKLIEPPLEAVPDLIEAGQRQRRQYDYDLQGRTLAALAAQGRAEFIRQAEHYTRSYRDVPSSSGTQRLLLAGHQPQLFHPGVWFKNFMLGRLARRHQAVPVNLVIDSDTIKSAAIRVPSGDPRQPVSRLMPYDAATAEIPFERREIQDGELFASFGDRAAEAIAPFVAAPLVADFWPLAVARSRETRNLGECLAQARHQWEGGWGLDNLEIPLSRVCQLECFHWFVAHLVAHLPRLWDIYNDSLQQYRRVHHLRSINHPVPDLAVEDDWLEAPFWIWNDQRHERRRLFVRQRGDQIVLADREGLEVELPLSADADGAAAVERLAGLGRRGIQLRTRALSTTLFVRLFLGDLFLHGIGGGKYDQLTDFIACRFFRLEPPPWMVVSGTLRLPIEREQASPDDARRIHQRLRELEFHPEKFLPAADGRTPAGDEAARLAEEKLRWIHTPNTPANARRRCHAIRRVNEALQPYIEDERQLWLSERERVARLLGAEAVLASREYAFCLYPAETLRDFLLAFPSGTP